MNREIKFRAWDTNTEQMITDPAFIQIDGDGDFQVFIDSESHWLNSRDGVFIMQFTGLKDKNGKDIYEGDILRKTVKDNGAKPTEFHVNWHDAKCGYNIHGAALEDPKHFYEVVGNIYEHPNLLKYPPILNQK